MQETADLIFHVEPPPTPGLLPTGPLVLQGWVYGQPGRHIVDLRARYAGKILPAVFGLPRADLAQYFKHHRPQLMAGFDLGLVLQPGENLVELEALDLSGQWLSLGRHPVVTAANSAAGAAPAGAIHPFDFSRALRLLLRRLAQGGELTSLAETLASELPAPRVTRYPHHPFHGHLDHPSLVAFNQFGRLMVAGWVFHETQPIRRVLASYDLLAWSTLEHGRAMPSVTSMFPQFAQAKGCGFHGLVDAPAQLPSPLSLRIYAELADGTWELCHLQRVHTYDGEQVKLPFPRRHPLTFWRAWRALRSACRQRGFVVSFDPLFRTELIASAREYWTRAPQRNLCLGFAQREPGTIAPAQAGGRSPGNQKVSTGPTGWPGGHNGAPLPARVALITHNLNLEGAPLFLLEYARHLAAAGTRLTVITGADGPLRADYEKLQADVQLVEAEPLLRASSAGALRRALATLAAKVELHDAGLVVANTLSAFWGVQLARLAGKPSLLYIHESTTPHSFYYGHLAPQALPVVEETFAQATHISFLTETTRRYYQPWLTQPNHSLNPGWINLGLIDRFRAANPRATLRARLGIDAETRLVVNVGTVCERKGPHIFIRAVEQLWREQPALAASARFLIVGGRHAAFDDAMSDLLRNVDRPNLQIIPETTTPFDYYGAADLFVCSSYEESFPRVVLEAMAFELPILATSVHGVPEMTRPGEEADLVPPGDSFALARGLARLLQDPAHGRHLAEKARSRVVAEYDTIRLLPRHAALAGAVARRQP